MYTLMKNANTGELVKGSASLPFTTAAGTDIQGTTKTTKVVIKDSRHATHYRKLGNLRKAEKFYPFLSSFIYLSVKSLRISENLIIV